MSHTTETAKKQPNGEHLALIHNSDFSGDVEFVQLVTSGKRDERAGEMTVDGDQFIELALQVVVNYLQANVLPKKTSLGSKVATVTAITVLEDLLETL